MESGAAEEIFSEVEKTIVCYEEELDAWTPPSGGGQARPTGGGPGYVPGHLDDIKQQHDWKDQDVSADHQVYSQGRTCSLEREKPEPLQVKEEQNLSRPKKNRRNQDRYKLKRSKKN
ncbi:hypothetical protein CRENBAI_006384 [Crenichthys baileyi]|uniref:Uncharacterized protein n=1 Tax=Crenichthys baileyi TaxID=28760 RepID=A0AAV9RMZ4_9TELE